MVLSKDEIQKMMGFDTIIIVLLAIKMLISLLLYCFIMSIAYCDIVCSPDFVYMKTIRQCQDQCSKESFLVLDGDIIVYSSPFCEDYECRILEGCLPPSQNLQYSVMLVDSSKNSWSSGSWLTIVGEYGNTLFKNYLTELHEEVYSISFYRPISKDDVWKLTYNMITGSWTSYGYSDSAWSSVTLGSVPIVVMGTQYLRKKFVGLEGMASYELSMFYKHGVVAYVNGREVVRDNMPSGSIQSSTYATMMYETESYHSFIRPGNEVKSDKSILAVELHFVQGVQQTSCTFNAFVALYTPSISSSPCWVLPFDITMSSQTNTRSHTSSETQSSSSFNSGDTVPFQAFNFNKDDCYMINPFTFATVDFLFDTTIRSFINGLRFWPSSDVYNTPNEFYFGGITGASVESLPMMHATNIRFTSNHYSTFFGYLNTGIFNSYRLTVPKGNGQALYLWEVQPLVCALEDPQSIPFDPKQYSFFVNQEIDPISPSIFGFTRCSILPALPDGLYVDETSCTIRGIPKAPQLLTEYRIISTGSQVLSGEVSIEVKQSEGNLIIIRRQYGDKAMQESFSIFSEDDGSLLYSVPVNSGQIPFTSTEVILHVTCPLIRIVLDCVEKSWSPNSYVYILFRLNDKETETLLRASFDEYLNLPSSYVLFAQYVIPPKSLWFYTDSISEKWYDETVNNWIHGTMDHFPDSNSQIQMYKKIFTIDSLNRASGFVVNIRYRYGVILYLNRHEVYRNHVTGPLQHNLYAKSSYNTLLYRSVSLPIRSIADRKARDYLVEGENIIALAVIAQGQKQVASYYDCTLQLLPLGESSRVLDYNVSSSRCISGDEAFMLHHSFMMKAIDCPHGDIILSFANDRHEWISSLIVQAAYDSLKEIPQGFTVSARNHEDSDWTTLSVVKNLTFFLPGQSIRIWFENNKAYNKYRISNFFNSESLVTINRLDLFSDCTIIPINNLTYSDIVVYQGIQMTELYPSSPYFTNFTIQPPLPQGLFIDPFTGIIQGLTEDQPMDIQFTVTARQVTGGWQSAVFHLFIDICEDSYTLVNVILKTSRLPDNNRLVITQGSLSNSDPVIVVDPIPCCNEFVYQSLCLMYDVYTLFFEERLVHVPHIDTGYSLSVSDPPFIVDTVFLHDHSSSSNISSMFSTHLPFEMKRSLWKVYGEEAVPTSWTDYDFDDRTWTNMYPSLLPPMKVDTLYLRRSFFIDRLDAVPVLNVHVWYIGGIIAYLNGVRVARFRISLDNTLQSTNQEIISNVFHILLAISGGRNESNVLAIELRFQKGSTPYFDATGIYGVEPCSRVLDSITLIESDHIENPKALFQMGTWGITVIPNSYPFISWRVDNEEGSLFNQYRLVSRQDYEGLSYELSALIPHTNQDEMLAVSVNQTLLSHTSHRHSVPYGMMGFREFHWSLHRAVWMTHQFLSFSLYYCQNSALICPGSGDFPPVAEGQISPAPCENGFTGYRYRECMNGSLGTIHRDHCHMLPPECVSYGSDMIEFVQGLFGESNEPSYFGIVNRFYVDPGYPLPEGLELDPTSGVIQGIPMEVVKSVFTVYAENEGGVRSSRIFIVVRKGKCSGTGLLPEGQVGDVVTINCRTVGMGFGTRTVQCILGDRDGVWENERGVCVSYIYIILVVAIIIALVVSIVVLLFSHKRKEALRKRRSVRHRLTSEGNRTVVVY